MIIDDLHEAILTKTNEAIQGLQTVAAYPEVRQKIAVPGILIELDEFEPGDDKGTEQTSLICHWQAFCLVAFNVENARVLAMQMAAEFMHLIRMNRWGVENVGPGKLITGEPDEFNPDWQGYYAWRVEWTHEILIGDNVWEDLDGVVPTEVWVGMSPCIGEAHVNDYVEVTKSD